MQNKRPINLNLFTLRFPITAIVSILHRASGVLLFLLMPLALCFLDKSLLSEEHFLMVRSYFTSSGAKLVLWVASVALFYHVVAGIRHLLMDLSIGETREGGRLGAKLVLAVVAIFAVIAWMII